MRKYFLLLLLLLIPTLFYSDFSHSKVAGTFDPADYGIVTWGSGADFTWTFNSDGATDQTWLFEDYNTTITTACTGAGTNIGGLTLNTTASGAADVNNILGIKATGTGNTSTATSTIHGGELYGYISDGSATEVIGAYGEARAEGDAIASSIYGGYFYADVAATAQATDVRQLQIDSASSGGTITNNYGIYIAEQNAIGSTLNYQIYSLGTAPSYFEGLLQSSLWKSTAANPADNAVGIALGNTQQICWESDPEGNDRCIAVNPSEYFEFLESNTFDFRSMNSFDLITGGDSTTDGFGFSTYGSYWSVADTTSETVEFGFDISANDTTPVGTPNYGGVRSSTLIDGSQTFGAAYGFQGSSTLSTTGANGATASGYGGLFSTYVNTDTGEPYSYAIGSDSSVSITGTGNVAWAVGASGIVNLSTDATATAESAMGLYAGVSNPISGSLTNSYGLYIANIASGSTETYAILSIGNAPSLFNGNVEIDDAKELRFYETDAGGSNYQALKAPTTLGGDATFALNITEATCTGDGNGGALTVVGGEIVCSPDAGGGFDPTQYGNVTWGNNADFTWTFNGDGATDQTWLFADYNTTVTTATTGVGTDIGGLTLTSTASGASDVNNIWGIKATGTGNTSTATSEVSGGRFFSNLTDGSTTNTIGVYGAANLSGDAITSKLYGGYFYADVGGTAQVTDLYQLRLAGALQGETITNNYGLYIDAQQGVGSVLNYQIFSNGTAPSYFAGLLQSTLFKSQAADPADNAAGVGLGNTEGVCWEADAAGTDVCIATDGNEIIQVTGGTLDGADLSPATVTGDQVAASIAGRSLTLNSATPDTLDVDAELYTETRCANINPNDAITNWFMYSMPSAATVTEVACWVDAATSVVLTARECDSNGANCADIEAAMTCATTKTVQASGVDNASLDADDVIRITRGTETGAVSQAFMCIKFTVTD